MKAVILAGGLGTRLSEETDRIPKPMVEIGGKPIVWHIMKIYAQHGIKDFVLCLGYKGYLFKEYFINYLRHTADVTVHLKTGGVRVHNTNEAEDWRVTMIDTGMDTQTGGRLARVRDYLDGETFCMTYGDGVSDVNITELIAFHRSHKKKATVTSVMPLGRFGVLALEKDKVTGFAEKVDNVGAHINGGFFVLEPGVIDYVENENTLWEKQPMERLAREGELMAFQHNGFWQPMDTLRDRRTLEELWQSGTAPWKTW